MTTRTRRGSPQQVIELPVGSPAAPTAIAQIANVVIVWQLTDGVLVAIARTLKRGATYRDSWSVSPSVALESATVVERREHGDTYVSRVTIDAFALASDTTYTFSYAIVMRAGPSTWVGSISIPVTLGPDGAHTPPSRGSATSGDEDPEDGLTFS